MSGVVVDTSVWIDYFAGRSVARLEEALESGAVVLPPLVVAELVSGAHRPNERKALITLLNAIPVHETPRIHWVRVGELRRSCKENGLSISTPDAHVAQCALDRDALLLAFDEVFLKIASRTGLRIGRS